MPSLAISRGHTNTGLARSKRWNVFSRVFFNAHGIDALKSLKDFRVAFLLFHAVISNEVKDLRFCVRATNYTATLESAIAG